MTRETLVPSTYYIRLFPQLSMAILHAQVGTTDEEEQRSTKLCDLSRLRLLSACQPPFFVAARVGSQTTIQTKLRRSVLQPVNRTRRFSGVSQRSDSVALSACTRAEPTCLTILRQRRPPVSVGREGILARSLEQGPPRCPTPDRPNRI